MLILNYKQLESTVSDDVNQERGTPTTIMYILFTYLLLQRLTFLGPTVIQNSITRFLSPPSRFTSSSPVCSAYFCGMVPVPYLSICISFAG